MESPSKWFLEGENQAYLYIMSKGMKNVSYLILSASNKKDAIKELKSYEKDARWLSNCGLTVNFLLHKNKLTYGMIAYLSGHKKKAQKVINILNNKHSNINDDIELGKIFGYSEKAIKKFLSNLKKLEKQNGVINLSCRNNKN